MSGTHVLVSWCRSWAVWWTVGAYDSTEIQPVRFECFRIGRCPVDVEAALGKVCEAGTERDQLHDEREEDGRQAECELCFHMRLSGRFPGVAQMALPAFAGRNDGTYCISQHKGTRPIRRGYSRPQRSNSQDLALRPLQVRAGE